MATVTGAFQEFLTEEQKAALRRTAQYIVAPGKGILAADESTGMNFEYIYIHYSFVF